MDAAAWNMAGYGGQQGAGQSSGAFSSLTPDQEVAMARAQMFDSVHHLSTSLRNAANQCDNFVKVINRHHPSAAATTYASQVGNDFLALANGANLAGLAPQIMPTSRKNMTKEERRALKKHRKLTRDPNAPKRPPSAYLLFQNEIREDMRHQFKDLSYAEVLGKISEAWKNLTEDQRKVYQDRCIEMMKHWNDYRRNQQSIGQAMGQNMQQQQQAAQQAAMQAAQQAAQQQHAANAYHQQTGEDDDEEEDEDEHMMAANGAALQNMAPTQAQHHAAAAATIAAAAAAQQQDAMQQQEALNGGGKKKPKSEKKSRKHA